VIRVLILLLRFWAVTLVRAKLSFTTTWPKFSIELWYQMSVVLSIE
jgi:hypothetical protein